MPSCWYVRRINAIANMPSPYIEPFEAINNSLFDFRRTVESQQSFSEITLVHNPSSVMTATSNQGSLKIHWRCSYWSGRMTRSLGKCSYKTKIFLQLSPLDGGTGQLQCNEHSFKLLVMQASANECNMFFPCVGLHSCNASLSITPKHKNNHCATQRKTLNIYSISTFLSGLFPVKLRGRHVLGLCSNVFGLRQTAHFTVPACEANHSEVPLCSNGS